MPKKKIHAKLLGGEGHCIFCLSDEDDEDSFGKFVHKKTFSIHYFCMLFSSGLMQRGEDTTGVFGFLPLDIFAEVNRGRKLRCQYCRKPGATIGCVVKSCRTSFHLPCGRKRGSLHQFYDQFCSYCPDHRPLQHLPPRVSEVVAAKLPSKTASNCLICMNPVEQFPTNESIFTVCCDNAWLHRQCVQKNATSAGIHFFKCPLCNNREDFQLEMRELGIYIPDQDAAWEREPNAYQELLERYCHCDCARCKCPHGRTFNKDNSKWEILVCKDCGSQACHIACDGLKSSIIWTCPTCIRIGQELKKKNKGKKKSVEDIKEVAKQLEESYSKLEAKLCSGPSTSGAQTPSSNSSFMKKTLVTCSQTDASTGRYKTSRSGRRRGLRTDEFQDSILKSETVTISDSSDQMQDVDVLNCESSNDNEDKEIALDKGRSLRHTRRVNYNVQNSKPQSLPPEFRVISPSTVSGNTMPKENQGDSQSSLHTHGIKRKRGNGGHFNKGFRNTLHERKEIHANVDAKRTPPKGTGLLLQHLKSQMQDEDTNSSGISIASTSSASAASDSWPPAEEHTSTRMSRLRRRLNSDQHTIGTHLDKTLRQNSNSSSLSSANSIRKSHSVRSSPRFTSRKLSDSSTSDSIIELPSTSTAPETDDANNNNTPPPPAIKSITSWYQLDGLSYEEYEKQKSVKLSQGYDTRSSGPAIASFDSSHSVTKGYSVHSINKPKSPTLNSHSVYSTNAESCDVTFGKPLIPLEPQYDDIYDNADISRAYLGVQPSQSSLSGAGSQNETEAFVISDDDSDIMYVGSDTSNTTQSDFIPQYGPNSTAAEIASRALSSRDGQHGNFTDTGVAAGQKYQKQFSAAQLQETYDYHDNLVSSGVRMEACFPSTSASSIPARYSISDPGNVAKPYQTGQEMQGVHLVPGGMMGPVLQRAQTGTPSESLSSSQAVTTPAAAEWWPVISRVIGSSSLHNISASSPPPPPPLSYPQTSPVFERVGGSPPYPLSETHSAPHSSRLIQRVSPFRYQPDTDSSVSAAHTVKDYNNDVL